MEFNLTRRNSRQIALVCMAMLMNWAAISAASDSGRVPPSPDKPWFPAPLSDYESELAHDHFRSNRNPTAVEIDANKVYDLPELIDIGERSNPQTRIAWEHARQAAAAVGLSQSAYFPFLAASAGAGYERAFIPFPTLQVGPGATDVSITGGGNLTTEAVGERAALGVKWLVCDFGERKAELAMAKEGLMAANVGFNAVHQQIVFAVTQHFYDFNTARQKVAVAESAVKAADTVARSARARFDHGLAIKPEVLQAEQQSAQAVFDLVAARGALSDAGVALVDSLGILPTTPLHVAEVPDKAFSESVGDAEELIDRALSQRPDLVAQLANVRAKRALVSKARAAYYPKIAVDAHVGDLSVSKALPILAETTSSMVLAYWSICRFSTAMRDGTNCARPNRNCRKRRMNCRTRGIRSFARSGRRGRILKPPCRCGIRRRNWPPRPKAPSARRWTPIARASAPMWTSPTRSTV